MKEIDNVIRDIKSLRIQGAEAVALSSVKALQETLREKRFEDRADIAKFLEAAISNLSSSRPTEPLLRNCLNYVKNAFFSKEDANVKSVLDACNFVSKHIEESKRAIAEIGENKIKDGMIVFTHCHSSTVVSILRLAHEKGKVFTVYNTETRPLFQGRKTAKELAECGIVVKHMVDSAARIGLKKADIALIGTDAITSEGRVINKIGSEMFAEIARRYDVPFFSCTDSWKFDPQSVFGFDEPIENRNSHEVWEGAPEGVKILNPAFENIRSDLVTGIISELGLFTPEVFVEEVKKRYPFLFSYSENRSL
ncbi:MAG: translation initiation factor eIF-2B [Candidatus Micrarchaeota archaeon]|nr:translation initiation factor eIF-2B [Candidatus Micrarchaeota archaeon]